MERGQSPVLRVAVANQRPAAARRRDASATRRPPGAKTADDGITRRKGSLKRAKNSTEQLRARMRSRDCDIHGRASPEGPAGREGRQFTVRNIGNNGALYLRPVVRSGASRTRPNAPPFVFPPATPPDSAKADIYGRESSNVWRESLFSALYSPQRRSPPHRESQDDHAITTSPPRGPPHPRGHNRAHSFSTVSEHTPNQSLDQGTFKVIIHRPSVTRPRTAENGLPHIEVSIPHYRLGTPQFKETGTPILRSSAYTRTSAGGEEPRSSVFSRDRLFPSPLSVGNRSSMNPRSDHNSGVYGKQSSRASFDVYTPRVSTMAGQESPSSMITISPKVYDPLATNPDDPKVVRYHPVTGEILAATPSRLVAHITSPSFLDYELLSDFFLTFRRFLQTSDLVAYLIARLRWAVSRADDFGRIARVRTFVALRHWILNYFVDDFLPDFQLRIQFCNMVNGLYEDLRIREDGGGGDLKIIGELKKCWRRTCALYWDDPETAGRDFPDDHILPGGQMGSRDSRVTLPMAPAPASAPALVSKRHSEYQPQTPPRHKKATQSQDSSHQTPAGQTPAGQMPYGSEGPHQSVVSSALYSAQENPTVPLSPASEISMQVLSCSIPMRSLHRNDPSSGIPLYPRPADPNFHLQKAPSSRPSRPSRSHKRSGSFSDALRDNREPLPQTKTVPEATRISAISPFPGSLVRGAVYQPTSPYFEYKPTMVRLSKGRTDRLSAESGSSDGRSYTGSNPGLKKMIGTVRRALSNRQPGGQPYSNEGQNVQPPRTMLAKENKTTPGNVPPDARANKPKTERPLRDMRVDLLAVRVNESFRQALAAEVGSATRDAIIDGESKRGDIINPAPDSGERSDERKRPQLERSHHSEVTAGSRSIVIVDDTAPPAMPYMSGGLPAPELSALNFDFDAEKTPVPDSCKRAESPDDAIPLSNSDAIASAQEALTSHPTNPDEYPSTGSSTPVRPPSALRYAKSVRTPPSVSSSLALRRYASFQSGIARHRPEESINSIISTAVTDATSGSEIDPFVLERPPARPLRRRPGGDLRALHHGQIENLANRPRSTGSLSNRTHSVTNSVALQSLTFSGDTGAVTSLATQEVEAMERRSGEVSASSGATAESGRSQTPQGGSGSDPDSTPERRRRVSLMDTHSSQPNLRPSFEMEVAKLRELPDDYDDDGGIESALLKLEGRYERRSPVPSPVQDSLPTTPKGKESIPSHDVPKSPAESRRHARHKAEVGDPSIPLPPRETLTQSASVFHPSGATGEMLIERQSVADSEDSYNSVPLLERGMSDSDRTAGKQRRLHHQSRSHPQSSRADVVRSKSATPSESHSPASSTEYIEKTDSMRRIPEGGTMPAPPEQSPPRHKDSFLLEDSRASASSDLSTDIGSSEDGTERVRSFYDNEPMRLDRSSDVLPHPLRLPPTPPQTGDRLAVRPPVAESTIFQRGLPTPGVTPVLSPAVPSTWPLSSSTQVGPPKTAGAATTADTFDIATGKYDGVKPTQARTTEPTPRFPTSHMPFVLAHDPEVLAEQFTIIEKDALDEIDWKELIELRWKQSSPEIRDWVEYLRTQTPRGVDVVIARFNLVVKWALSEIVLSENIEERARCVIHYIHIADHARRLRNYATMYQITIALLSTDCSRLKKTWQLVPREEQQMMESLESVVQPLKNFHNLRAEMETAAVEEGCVPFIGIYTRDLVFNANKPDYITTPPVGEEPLVNFERHRTAAGIVKSLLRLLEASSKYKFQAEPSIISKCLWMAALDDNEIARLSRKLE